MTPMPSFPLRLRVAALAEQGRGEGEIFPLLGEIKRGPKVNKNSIKETF